MLQVFLDINKKRNFPLLFYAQFKKFQINNIKKITEKNNPIVLFLTVKQIDKHKQIIKIKNELTILQA